LTAALLTLAVSVAYAGTTGNGSAAQPSVFTPDTIKWTAGTGAMKGVMVAALDGDWSKPGPFTVRLKFPDATKLPAHYHSDTERATVISGVFCVGVGSTFDASKLTPLPAGSFVVIPANVRHFALTQGETVIQLSGTGPFDMKMDAAAGGM
jgi:anti-sigma factor ChrR (cupin superfamily)